MKFETFRSQKFISLIEKVYRIQRCDSFVKFFMPEQLPLFVSQKPFKNRFIFNLPFCFYQTAEVLHELVNERLWAELAGFSAHRGFNICITSLGKLNLPNGVLCANNPILSLEEYSSDLSIYSKNHRQNVKKERNKATRMGLNICVTSAIDDLLQFYNLMAYQYVKEHKMVFQPYELFIGLLLNGLGRLLVAKKDNKVVGGLFGIVDENTFHYNWGVRGVCSNLNIGTLLVDEAVNYAHKLGYSFFDLGSTPLSDDGLLKFKMKWGSDNYKVYKYFSATPKRPIDLNKSLTITRQFFRLMPIGIAKKLMPHVVPWIVH